MKNNKFINETIGERMNALCEKYKNNEAIYYEYTKESISYKELNNRIEDMAKYLISLNIKKGEHIAVFADSSPNYIVLLLACAKIGAVLVCINHASTQHELQYVITQSKSTILFSESGHFMDISNTVLKNKSSKNFKKIINLDEIDDLIKLNTCNISNNQLKEIESMVKPNDVATIQYTSGTTGNPKAVMSTHYAILNNSIVCADNFGINQSDVVLLGLPLFHVMGCVLTAILVFNVGASIVLLKRFQTTKVLELIQEKKCTAFNGVPTMYKFLLNNCEGYDVSTLEKGMIAGSYCSPKLLTDIMNTLNMRKISTVYGQTEAMAITQTVHTDSMEKRLNTIGKPLDGVIAMVLDINTQEKLPCNSVGELCVKTEYLMDGYFDNEVATKNAVINGVLHTGDLAVIDEDGYITLKGRIKEIIIRGGENICPLEIEEAVKETGLVENIAVVGVDDELMGEELYAFVIKNKKNKNISSDEIKSICKQLVSKHKIPKYVEFVDEFPVNSTGKIQKYILKDIANKKITK